MQKIRFDKEKATGYVERRTEEEIHRGFEKTKAAEDLLLVGVLDGDDSEEKARDRTIALCHVMRGEDIPKDLLKRILKYREEDMEKYRSESE